MTVAMLLLPAASPRRLVTGALEAGDPAFYAVPTSTPAAPPGTVVRSEELLSVPDGSRAWRVLYHSTDPAGRDTVLSGIVVAPDSPAPAAGRAVVGWGHPTTGAAASCAPSNGVDPYLLVEGLPDLIRAGYVVVAPDYPGMGVPAPCSYLIGTSESRSLLDAVRAAHRATDRCDDHHRPLGPLAGRPRRPPRRTAGRERMRRSSPSAPPQSPPRPPTSGPCSTTTSATSRESPSGRTPFAAYQQAYAAQYPGLELTSILTDAGAAVTPDDGRSLPVRRQRQAARSGDAAARKVPAQRSPDHRALVGHPRREHPWGTARGTAGVRRAGRRRHPGDPQCDGGLRRRRRAVGVGG